MGTWSDTSERKLEDSFLRAKLDHVYEVILAREGRMSSSCNIAYARLNALGVGSIAPVARLSGILDQDAGQPCSNMKLPKEYQLENLDAMVLFPPKEDVSLPQKISLLSRRSREIASETKYTILDIVDDMKDFWADNAESIFESSIRISKATALSSLSIAGIIASEYLASSGKELGALAVLATALLTEWQGLRAIYTSEDDSLPKLRSKRIRL